MGDSITDKAVRDAKEIAELAREAARNEILESMSPGISRLVDRAVKDRLAQTNILSEGDTKMSGSNNDDLELESIAGVFSGINEEEDEGDGVHVDIGSHDLEEAEIPDLDQMESLDSDLDEEIEIDEAELNKHMEESLKLEVQMSKGLADLDLSGKEEVDQGNAVHDVKGGEQYFGDVEPPAKKDFTVKEIKALIRKGLAENERLRKENRALREKSQKLMEHLSRTNLFNSKVQAVNSIFSENRELNGKQKRRVVESIDKAKTVSEVKNIANAISSTLDKKQVQESKQKPRANAQRPRGKGADNRTIRESVDKSSNESPLYNRWQELSGIVNG